MTLKKYIYLFASDLAIKSTREVFGVRLANDVVSGKR